MLKISLSIYERRSVHHHTCAGTGWHCRPRSQWTVYMNAVLHGVCLRQ